MGSLESFRRLERGTKLELQGVQIKRKEHEHRKRGGVWGWGLGFWGLV